MLAVMARRIALFFDGTWQTLSQDTPTNIARMAGALSRADAGGGAQLAWYGSGVGAAPARKARQLTAGALGRGLEADMFEAYRFLALNAGRDDAIYLFGFSRGAWAARSLAGWLGACGLPGRASARRITASWAAYRAGADAARRMRAKAGGPRAIAFLGCFDTVGQLGVPDLVPGLGFDRRLNRARRFHDVRIGAHVARARQACALDETRRAFPLTPMTAPPGAQAGQVRSRWFTGAHGAVGGGEDTQRPLSDIALAWMAGEAGAAGLVIKARALDLQPDPLAPLAPPGGLLVWLGSAPRRIARTAFPEHMDDSVIVRLRRDSSYRPAALFITRDQPMEPD